MYERPPDAAELSAFGFLLTDLDDACDIWPDNIAAANVFIAMQTQWRAAMGGATGLDYNVLPSVFRLLSVPKAEWRDTFECVRVMEGEAIRVMNNV